VVRVLLIIEFEEVMKVDSCHCSLRNTFRKVVAPLHVYHDL
jgi:hypothetical protein